MTARPQYPLAPHLCFRPPAYGLVFGIDISPRSQNHNVNEIAYEIEKRSNLLAISSYHSSQTRSSTADSEQRLFWGKHGDQLCAGTGRKRRLDSVSAHRAAKGLFVRGYYFVCLVWNGRSGLSPFVF